MVVVSLVLDDDMAGAAGARSAASAFHLQLMVLRDVEEVCALRDVEGVRVGGLIDYGEVEAGGTGISFEREEKWF